jgi:ribonuclease VapC
VIVDASAIVAILRREPEALSLLRALDEAPARRISAASLLETAIVIDGARDAIASRQLDDFCRLMELIVEPVAEAHVRIARDAYRDFGQGSGHPAGLNFGDCFSYALAKVTGEPLLFKGDDFAHTDVTPAV